MRKRKTEKGAEASAPTKTAEDTMSKVRRRRKKRKKEREEERKSRLFLQSEDFSPSCFSLQTDAKADGGELAENGRRRNETVY